MQSAWCALIPNAGWYRAGRRRGMGMYRRYYGVACRECDEIFPIFDADLLEETEDADVEAAANRLLSSDPYRACPACGHRDRYSIDDLVIALFPAEVIDPSAGL